MEMLFVCGDFIVSSKSSKNVLKALLKMGAAVNILFFHMRVRKLPGAKFQL